MTEVSGSARRRHFLLISFPAFGHIIPLLELGKKMSEHHDVTFLVSNNKLDAIAKRNLIPPEYGGKLQLQGLQDGLVKDLDSQPGVDEVLRISNQMAPALTDFLQSLPSLDKRTTTGDSALKNAVDVVLTERFLAAIVQKSCEKLQLPCCIFHTSSPSAMLEGLDVTEETVALPVDAPTTIGEYILREDYKQFLLMQNEKIESAKALILNTFHAADKDALKSLAKHPRTATIPVLCVGPILPPENQIKSAAGTVMEERVEHWLEGQKPKSVIYVSFGSIGTLSSPQIVELLTSLQTLDRPFIFSLSEESQNCLPEDVRGKIKKQFDDWETAAFLVLPWVPQKAILTHPSTGVFITHAGWNSILEGIVGGVPMVAWPLFADQPMNGRWAEQNGCAIFIPRFSKGQIVPSAAIAKSISAAEKCRVRAREMSTAVAASVSEGGSSHGDFMKLLSFGSKK
jgi:UDP:flavonoid glycosyltransferase YjiC (YdhE family)